MAVIGIDLGTSFVKAAVLDVERNQLENIRRVPFPGIVPGLDSLRCEFDPQGVVNAVQELIRQITDSATSFDGLVMCTQMSSMVLMNSRGEAQSNCLGWRDQRALEPHPSGFGSYYDVLKQRITPAQRRELGNELPPGAPASFLFWFAEQGMLEPGLIPSSLADFVLTTLCGSHTGVDVTNAMAYELLELAHLQWHEAVIERLGLSELQWPVLRRQGEVVGLLKIRGHSVPCYAPVGDYQCALVGALLSEQELSLNISTGSQVSRLARTLTLGDYQTRPFFDGRFTNTVSHLPAGRSLDVLLGLVTELSPKTDGAVEQAWSYIARVAAEVDRSDLQANLSFFPGPCGDRGSISNIREKNLTLGTLFRASFENMADNYYECALRIWPEREWDKLVFSGGLARKLTVLRSVIEGRLGTKSRLCPLEEDTLLGLLVLARAFTKRSGSVEQAMSDITATMKRIASAEG